MRGRRVVGLYRGKLDAGEHELRWDGRDARGREVGSGMYLLRLKTRDASVGRKLILAR